MVDPAVDDGRDQDAVAVRGEVRIGSRDPSPARVGNPAGAPGSLIPVADLLP